MVVAYRFAALYIKFVGTPTVRHHQRCHRGESAIKKPDRYAIRSIPTDADYRAPLALVAPYFDNEPEIDSDAGAHFEAMVTLIEAYEAYEAKQYPMSPPDSIEAILFHMEQEHNRRLNQLQAYFAQQNCQAAALASRFIR